MLEMSASDKTTSALHSDVTRIKAGVSSKSGRLSLLGMHHALFFHQVGNHHFTAQTSGETTEYNLFNKQINE